MKSNIIRGGIREVGEEKEEERLCGDKFTSTNSVLIVYLNVSIAYLWVLLC